MEESPAVSNSALRIHHTESNEEPADCSLTPDSEGCSNNGSRKCKDRHSDYLNSLAEISDMKRAMLCNDSKQGLH